MVPITQEEVVQLFLAYEVERRAPLIAGKRLVHYTSAEAAYRIVTGRQVWMRSAGVMNDFSEIAHGLACLRAAWDAPSGNALQELLNRLRAGLRDELQQVFDGHVPGFRESTFITSLSEHDDDEDQLGRLSMWRAYGGRSGVALVLNPTAFAAETDTMKVFSSPVRYMDAPMFVEWFDGWSGGLVAAEERLKLLGADGVLNILFMVFRSIVMCTKHPGFAEEKEWRVFYSPIHEGDSDWVTSSTEVVSGVPQLVMKIELKDDADRGVKGVAPDGIVNRVIIGPCEYPLQVRAAMENALIGAGVQEAAKRITISFVPLRQS